MRTYLNTRNPILPPDIHIPDSEAHVMPDGRLYLYGSFDTTPTDYCSPFHYVVSTADMKEWTLHDQAISGYEIPWFNNAQSTDALPVLYAPDCICKDGKYYLYLCMTDNSEGAAVADHPEGPFHNPVRLPVSQIDPAIFPDDDGSIYYYWGQFHSKGVRMKDMTSLDPSQIVDNLLTEEEHFFHEGSSMRKIGENYYYVYADIERGRPTALGYAMSKSPLGPFTYKGIIIDNMGCDPETWNNHGSIECFHGQWYVFYHRSSRCTRYMRRLCIEPITINPDGTIDEVCMTSQGPGKPFAPGEKIEGRQACQVQECYIDAANKHGSSEWLWIPGSDAQAVFRYVQASEGLRTARAEAFGSGIIDIFLNEQKLGQITMLEGKMTDSTFQPLPAPDSENRLMELKLVFRHADQLKLVSITLE